MSHLWMIDNHKIEIKQIKKINKGHIMLQPHNRYPYTRAQTQWIYIYIYIYIFVYIYTYIYIYNSRHQYFWRHEDDYDVFSWDSFYQLDIDDESVIYPIDSPKHFSRWTPSLINSYFDEKSSDPSSFNWFNFRPRSLTKSFKLQHASLSFGTLR